MRREEGCIGTVQRSSWQQGSALPQRVVLKRLAGRPLLPRLQLHGTAAGLRHLDAHKAPPVVGSQVPHARRLGLRSTGGGGRRGVDGSAGARCSAGQLRATLSVRAGLRPSLERKPPAAPGCSAACLCRVPHDRVGKAVLVDEQHAAWARVGNLQHSRSPDVSAVDLQRMSKGEPTKNANACAELQQRKSRGRGMAGSHSHIPAGSAAGRCCRAAGRQALQSYCCSSLLPSKQASERAPPLQGRSQLPPRPAAGRPPRCPNNPSP